MAAKLTTVEFKPPSQKDQEYIVGLCERALERAKKGEFKAICIISSGVDKNCERVSYSADSLYQFLGMIEWAKYHVMLKEERKKNDTN